MIPRGGVLAPSPDWYTLRRPSPARWRVRLARPGERAALVPAVRAWLVFPPGGEPPGRHAIAAADRRVAHTYATLRADGATHHAAVRDVAALIDAGAFQ